MKNVILSTIFLAFALLGCVKDDFDRPNPYEDPPLVVNQSIKGLKDYFIKYSDSTKINVKSIDENWVISGIVTADDKSQNFYKEIVIQDSTAGIGILIDQNSLYNDYPIGRRVFIKLKDMSIGMSNNLIQLGGYVDSVSRPNVKGLGRLVSTKIKNHLVKGTLTPADKIIPLQISIDQLSNDYQYRLIQLNDMEFTCNDVNSTYADAVNQNDASRTLSDGKGKSIIVRSSGYSLFAGTRVAQLNGEAVGVYTVYNNDKQLKLRDITDLKFTNQRIEPCEAGPPISIKELRSLYKGAAIIMKAVAIEGIVISDKNALNINERNLILQDSSAGIMLRFTSNHSYNVGDKIKVNLRGGTLEEFGGTLQVNNAPNGNVDFIGSNFTITPRVATVAEIRNNFEAWESTLVKVQGATITGTGSSASKFVGSKTVTQSGQTLTLFTASAATFGSLDYPTGSVDIVAYLGQFNTTLQLQIRNEKDVTGGSGGGGGSSLTKIRIDSLRMKRAGATVGSHFIEGVVISDKDNKNTNGLNLIIQEGAFGGICIRFKATHNFALGDKVKVNLDGGLALSEFERLLQVNDVPLANASKISSGNTITPVILTPNQLTADFEKYESMLVRIDNATLPSGTYSGTQTIATSSGDFKLYTMTTAMFSGNTMPTGSLSLIGYVDQGTNDNRLVLRNPAIDVIGGSGGGGGATTDKTIMEIRNMFSGNGVILGKYKIKGVVISDRIANNTQSANIVIQDATGGIVVRFSASKTSGTPVNHSFNLNDEVEIVLEGDSLSKFRGLLQISRAQVSEATKVGTGSISPRVATIPEIIANFNQWESTLVKVINVNLTPVDSTYSSSTSNTTNPRHINNGTDKMVLFTRFSATSSLNRATFYNDLMPNGVRSLTGLLTFFDIQQISIRNSSDVQ